MSINIKYFDTEPSSIPRALSELKKSEDKVIEQIYKVLSKFEKLSIHEIAKKTGRSSNTVSKYLGIMEERGKIVKELQPPYKFYRLKADKHE